MALNNYQDADFTPDITPSDVRPNMGTYNSPQTFRFWCQKVLPLVYDNSLSYYELLCKVVDYLNKTMEDVNTAVQDVENLNTAFGSLENHVNASETALLQAYNDLQDYVNTYFNNLDVQEEINNKLDVMAEDGTLDAILLPYFNEYTEATDERIDEKFDEQNGVLNNQNNRIAVLEGRMDSFSSLPDGSLSTAADAELVDIRVGTDGTTYPTAGDAVRGQINNLILKDKDSVGLLPVTWTQGGIGNADGSDYTSPTNIRTNMVSVNVGDTVYMSEFDSSNYALYVHQYDSPSSYHGSSDISASQAFVVAHPYIRFRLTRRPGTSNITPVDAPTVPYIKSGYIFKELTALSNDLKTKALNTDVTNTTEITENTDLNDYTNIGNYRLLTSTAATVAHVPVYRGGRLLVMQGNALANLVQIYISIDGDMYIRTSADSGATWISWMHIITDKALITEALVTNVNLTNNITANSDLNDYVNIGNYRLLTSTAASVAHVPVYRGGRLIVLQGNALANLVQIYISIDGDIYIRTSADSGSTWINWMHIITNKALITEALATSVYLTEVIPENSDLDNYTNIGNYRVASLAVAATITNIPTAIGGRLLVMHSNAASNIEQIYITSTGLVYMRSGNASGFKQWVQLVTSANMQEASTLGTSINECAKTYYEYSKFDYFTYGNRSAFDYNEQDELDQINCSAFTALVIGGCPFYLSRYVDAEKPNRFYTAGYGFNFYQYARQLVKDGDATEIAYLGEHANEMPDVMIQSGAYRYTWLQAQALDRWGFTFDILNSNDDIDITKLEIGDIIYYGTTDPDPTAPDPQNRMLNGYYIRHCDVVTRKDADGTVYVHDAGEMPISIFNVTRVMEIGEFDYAIAARVPLL